MSKAMSKLETAIRSIIIIFGMAIAGVMFYGAAVGERVWFGFWIIGLVLVFASIYLRFRK